MRMAADTLVDPEPLGRAAGWATDGAADVDMIEMVFCRQGAVSDKCFVNKVVYPPMSV
jgi:hypothetical protein